MSNIKGFSKLSKNAKIEWVINNYFEDPEKALNILKGYWHSDKDIQKLHDEFIENTVSNFYLPLGVAPNFLINGEAYCIPMATEESSVVAAAAKSANFWLGKGGFTTKIISTTKIGHVHFNWYGTDKDILQSFFDSVKDKLISSTDSITKNMRQRGGGILSLELIDKTPELDNYYQLEAKFETCDSMGANFINSVLEEFAKTFKEEIFNSQILDEADKNLEIVMCILSNYNPECIVRAEVSATLEDLQLEFGDAAIEFATKFCRAVKIAEVEPYRATTHNKGIMNGIDSVVIATGNDFRAVEACAHTYAGRDGQYRSLTHASFEDDVFKFWIEVPLSLGTVGGITSLHPLVKFAHELMGNPDAKELMQITAVTGLAQNFSALRSLVTTGIQKGHMKMHLLNILNQLEATEEEKATIVDYFKDHIVSHSAAVAQFCKLRGIPVPEGKTSKK
jgi:hydroxymethylglutaryl-CoA reductase